MPLENDFNNYYNMYVSHQRKYNLNFKLLSLNGKIYAMKQLTLVGLLRVVYKTQAPAGSGTAQCALMF